MVTKLSSEENEQKENDDRDPGAYRWLVLFLTTLAQSFNSMIIYGVATLAPFLVIALNLSKFQVGLTSVAANIGIALTALVLGRMVDVRGEKPLLFLGILGASLFIVLASLAAAASFVLFFVFLLFSGTLAAAVTPAGGKAIVKWFPVSQLGFALGIRQTGVPVGGVLASLILPYLAICWGWQAALGGAGIIGIIGGLLFYLFYKERSGENPAAAGNLPEQTPVAGGYRKVLANQNIWMAAGMAMCFIGSQFILITYIQLFLHEEIGYSLPVASKFLTLVQLGGMIGRITWGFFSDHFLRSVRKPALLAIGCLVVFLALTMLLITPQTPLWVIAIIVFLLGFTAIGWNGLYVTLLAELAGGEKNAATAIGFGMNTNQIGVLMFPPLFGYLVDISDSYRLSWLFLAGLGLMGTFFASRIKEAKTVWQNAPSRQI